MSIHAKSFTYNGKNSFSDFNLILAGTDSESAGINMTLAKSELSQYRNTTTLWSRKYADVLQFDLFLMKCDGSPFNQKEAREITSWISSPITYREFTIQEFEENDYHNDIFYYAICTKCDPYRPMHPSMVNGFSCHFECNSAYGFSAIKTVNFGSESNSTINVTIENDDAETDIYPNILIVPGETGKIEISNSLYPEEVLSLSVTRDNELKVDCNKGIITDFAQVFDYETDSNLYWIHLANGQNTINVNGNCSGSISYREPRMVMI